MSNSPFRCGLLCYGAPSPSPTLLFPLLFLIILLLPCLSHWCFHKHVITEVPSALLVGLTVSCNGFIMELSGTACVWHRAATDLLPERLSLQTTPHYKILQFTSKTLVFFQAERKGKVVWYRQVHNSYN